ncbi:4'-phosphopantetheinyl transferase superfamily protein [Aquimarina sp. TRL1]|uniref:4'-phosphopantetheinyl transferase family protein n=1 Tax=Aquimarina sp. (strain TRL1) TaxID=2736252 RepID=UPI001588DE23|nr:4'-phosphopantetheinyl transferase superfamily protein [Aquimarina sp. TRL1]QKX04474.1 4'-phosphopantetheinyl transferase superfamily protein [Aquimarina sp. TRL1]
MPLYKTITVNNHTKVLIWKIDESFDFLSKDVVLTPHCQQRVDDMKSDIHRRGFMSIRHLLAVVGYTDFDLYYDASGKPNLKDGKQISITHSFEFSGIIISDKPVGIDIEKQRDKIQRIARKFINYESSFVEQQLYKTRVLTVIWGAKESLYKLYATPGLSFEQHIQIAPFDFDAYATVGKIAYKGEESDYTVRYLEFEGFTCVFTLPLEE